MWLSGTLYDDDATAAVEAATTGALLDDDDGAAVLLLLVLAHAHPQAQSLPQGPLQPHATAGEQQEGFASLILMDVRG